MRIRTQVKAGGFNSSNHNQNLRIRTSVKAGGFNSSNHNQKRA
jgi:hypothetical protein